MFTTFMTKHTESMFYPLQASLMVHGILMVVLGDVEDLHPYVHDAHMPRTCL